MSNTSLTGTWELVEFELKDPDGNLIHPFGNEAVGIFILDKSGYMSAQIMRPNRSKFDNNPPSPEEIQGAYTSYIAYYGKCQIDEKEGTFTTRVGGSLNPDWMGTNQIRYYEFSGETLLLKTPRMKIGGVEFTGTFSWVKTD